MAALLVGFLVAAQVVGAVGSVALRETGVSRCHPWQQRGTSDLVSVGSVSGADRSPAALIAALVDQDGSRIQPFFSAPREMRTPGLLYSEDALVGLLDRAQHTLCFEAYYVQKNLSDRFVAALDRAIARGVRVRLLLAELPSKDAAYAEELARHPNVEVRFLDLKKQSWLYGSIHTKTLLVDGHLTTFGGVNYSYMGLHENREVNVIIDDRRLAAAMQALFDRDWTFAHDDFAPPPPVERAAVANRDFILAEAAPLPLNHPGIPNLQPLMLALIAKARHSIFYSIDYYTEFGGIQAALEAAAKRGVKVRLLTEERSYSDENPLYEPARVAVRRLAASGIDGRILSLAPYGKVPNRGMMHAKTMIVDDELVLVGSNNISRSGLLYSREAGVLFRSRAVAAQLLAVFEADFADPLTLSMATYLEHRPRYVVEDSNGEEGANKTIRIVSTRDDRDLVRIRVRDHRVAR